MITCQQQEMARRGVASSIMRTGRVYVIKRTKEALRQKYKVIIMNVQKVWNKNVHML